MIAKIKHELIALKYVADEMTKAKAKHPHFPLMGDGVSIIAEELGELAQAVNDGENKQIITEAAHVAVTAIRFIEEMLKEMEG